MMINENGVEREATKEEIAQHAADNAARDLHNIAISEKIAAKQALLERLNITTDEADLLLG